MEPRHPHDRLYDIVDNESSAIEREEFIKRICDDKHLSRCYKLELTFRQTMLERGPRENCPQSLRAKIMSSLDGVDAERSATPEPFRADRRFVGVTALAKENLRPRLSLRYGLAMAASFTLLVLGGYAGLSFFRHQQAFGAVEGLHYAAREEYASAGQMSALSIQGEAGEAISFAAYRFNVAPVESLPGLQLCGGEMVQIDKADFAHFTFCAGTAEAVSIFIGRADSYNLPEMPSVTTAGRKFFSHSCHGCELLYWRDGAALVIAATSKQQMNSQPVSSLLRSVSVSDSTSL